MPLMGPVAIFWIYHTETSHDTYTYRMTFWGRSYNIYMIHISRRSFSGTHMFWDIAIRKRAFLLGLGAWWLTIHEDLPKPTTYPYIHLTKRSIDCRTSEASLIMTAISVFNSSLNHCFGQNSQAMLAPGQIN